MPWSYEAPPEKERDDQLGPNTLNQLSINAQEVRRVIAVEHDAAGAHNAVEVPIAIQRAWMNMGEYELSGMTPAMVTLETGFHPTEGILIVTPDPSYGFIPGMGVQVNIRDANVANVPHFFVTYFDFDAGTFKFTLFELGSGLGDADGNLALEVDAEFDFALHSLKFQSEGPAFTQPKTWLKGQTLSPAATDFNALVRNTATLNAAALVEHNADGTHNTPRVARAFAVAHWSDTGEEFTPEINDGISNFSHHGVGHISFETTAPFASTEQIHAFPTPFQSGNHPQRVVTGAPIVAHALPTADDTVHVYTYRFEDVGGGYGWVRCDASIAMPIYGELP